MSTTSNLGNANINEFISLLKGEKDNLEIVNSDLLVRLERKESEILSLREENDQFREENLTKDKHLDKAQTIIRKLNEEVYIYIIYNKSSMKEL